MQEPRMRGCEKGFLKKIFDLDGRIRKFHNILSSQYYYNEITCIPDL